MCHATGLPIFATHELVGEAPRAVVESPTYYCPCLTHGFAGGIDSVIVAQVFGGRVTVEFFKTLGKIVEAAETHQESDLAHIAMLLTQQRGGSFQSDKFDKLTGGLAGKGGEFAVQVGPAHGNLLTEAFHIKAGVGQVRFHNG